MMHFKVGDKVRRDTKEAGYGAEVGEILEFDTVRKRARIQWSDKRTWYRWDKLIYVSGDHPF